MVNQRQEPRTGPLGPLPRRRGLLFAEGFGFSAILRNGPGRAGHHGALKRVRIGGLLLSEDLDLNVMVHGVGAVAATVKTNVLPLCFLGINVLALVGLYIGKVLANSKLR